MSLILDIADAVAAELNAAPPDTFCQAFTARRRVLPEFDLEALSELQVTVVPKGVEITGATRTASQREIAVDIGLQKKLGADLESEVAELLELTERIAAYLSRRRLAAAPQAAWVAVANEPVYSPEHLAEQRAFTSVLTVTYRALG